MVAARISETASRIRIAFAGAYPDAGLSHQRASAIEAAPS